MTYKELRELCMSQTQLCELSFDELTAKIKNDKNNLDYQQKLVDMIFDTTCELEDVYSTDYNFERLQAAMYEAADTELGTSFYADAYNGDVERYIEDSKKASEYEAQNAVEEYAINHAYMFGAESEEIESIVNAMHGY
jgi:hypothetical protein